jgi:hypothetical protein
MVAALNFHLGHTLVMKTKSFNKLLLEGKRYKNGAATCQQILLFSCTLIFFCSKQHNYTLAIGKWFSLGLLVKKKKKYKYLVCEYKGSTDTEL